MAVELPVLKTTTSKTFLEAPEQDSPVRVIKNYGGRKLGKVSVTYASQYSCPSRANGNSVQCPFLTEGCYAESHLAGNVTGAVNRAGYFSPVEIAKREAQGLDKMSGKKPARLHMVGDCSTDDAARIVGLAAGRYMDRHGKPVWTYTHAWRDVSRNSWGRVSVLASTESPAHFLPAWKKGYALSIVVDRFPDDKRAWKEGPFTVVPCPTQVHTKEDCIACGLCLNASRLHKLKIVIAFASHGNRRNRVAQTVNAIKNGAP